MVVREPVAEGGRANETDLGRLLTLVRGAFKLFTPLDMRGTLVVVVQTSEEPWIDGTCDEPVRVTIATAAVLPTVEVTGQV